MATKHRELLRSLSLCPLYMTVIIEMDRTKGKALAKNIQSNWNNGRCSKQFQTSAKFAVIAPEYNQDIIIWLRVA